MKIPHEVTAWLTQNGFADIVQSKVIGGGCINNGAILEVDDGRTLFLKQNASAPADMFEREREGLIALRSKMGPRVPEPLLFGTSFLLMEDLRPAPPIPRYWEVFGRQLAELHSATKAQFGFEHDNYIGSTPQPNPWTQDGYEFFAQHRLHFQAELAACKGLLGHRDLQNIEKLIRTIPELIPKQPASLIHGDLWSGNATCDEEGQPAIIDPAAHYGWAEAELGMTTLFGQFPDRFYQAYEEVRPLDPGWQNRLGIYNLYHMLNHLNLFGTGYLAGSRSLIQKYL